jgi:hypothetical protein
VRNNQRRSRTRRRDYVADLERKLRDYEARKPPADNEVQNNILRLERENKKLKSLLKAAGLPQIWMDAYLKLNDESGNSGHQPLQDSIPSMAGSSVNASEIHSANERKSRANYLVPLLTPVTVS